MLLGGVSQRGEPHGKVLLGDPLRQLDVVDALLLEPDQHAPLDLDQLHTFITIADMVDAQARLIDHLGIGDLFAVIGGSMGGHLRAYDSKDGAVLWDYDTATTFSTLDGGTARGGSIGGGAGAVFSEGMMYVNAGYGIYFHMPGNVLLAFGLPDTD